MYNYVIGAGHTPYGAGCGAGGARGQLNESNCTRQVAPLVVEKLKSIGKSAKYIVFDRPNQSYLEDCYWRANQANSLGAEVYVEIHFNAGGGTGSEVVVSPKTGSYAREIAARVSRNIANTLNFRDRGVKESNLIVLNKTNMPAILVECCFVDNSIDFEKYNPDKIATAIVAGLTGQTVESNSTVKGWNQNNTGWWYCTDVANGYYYKNEWKYIDYAWFSFDNDGYARHDCWIQDGGKWYFLKSNCEMASSEWIKWKDKWYYVCSDGSMLANAWAQDSKKLWYFLGEDGAMVTNKWIEWKDKKYYLLADGQMATATIIDGITIGSDGVAIESVK